MVSDSTTPPPAPAEKPLFNQNQQDLIRLSEIINDPATTANDRKWAYTEIDRIGKGQIVPAVGAASAQERAKQVMGSNVPFTKAAELSAVPPTETKAEDVPKPDSGMTVTAPVDDQKFNTMLAQYSQQVAPQVNKLAEEAKKLPTPEQQKGFLERAISGLFGKSGLFGDQELIKFSLLAAGGLLTGGSVGGSVKFDGLNTLQSA